MNFDFLISNTKHADGPNNTVGKPMSTVDPKERRAAQVIKRLSPVPCRLGIILGSGFQQVTERLKPVASIAYSKIPGFVQPQVSGHAGSLHIGYLSETPVIVLSGRAHYYEGHSMNQVAFAVRALASYGVTDLLITNAAGGINPKLKPEDFMVITDHINMMGVNPLRVEQRSRPAGFLDLTEIYDRKLIRCLQAAAKQTRIRLRKGVYLAVSGPSYETPAEIRAFRSLGADAVGMSTVPEAIAARERNLRVIGLSCISNLAAGLSGANSISHREVLETANRVKNQAGALIERFAAQYKPQPDQ